MKNIKSEMKFRKSITVLVILVAIFVSLASISGIFSKGGPGNYDFHFGGTIFINPYIKTHSLISFGIDNHKQMLLESGIRVGFSF